MTKIALPSDNNYQGELGFLKKIFGGGSQTMTRSISRMVLSTLALVLLFAGASNLNRTSASQAKNWCLENAGCVGGPCICAMVVFPDGTTIMCGEPCSDLAVR